MHDVFSSAVPRLGQGDRHMELSLMQYGKGAGRGIGVPDETLSGGGVWIGNIGVLLSDGRGGGMCGDPPAGAGGMQTGMVAYVRGLFH